MRARRALLALPLALAACGGKTADPRAQWTVHLATDLPVPQLGDRVLIELLAPDGQAACPGCRRQLGTASAEQWPLSFGVVPPSSGAAVRVRVRLYRAVYTGADGLPAGNQVVDYLGTLPSTDTPLDVTVELRGRCFGVPADVDAHRTCDPATGALVAEADVPRGSTGLPDVGSWSEAEAVPCAGAVPDGMVCVPGGLFLLGSARYFSLGSGDPTPERLVRLSPFALDLTEVTVGTLRRVLQDTPLSELPVTKGATPPASWCSWRGASDPSGDEESVNCLPLSLAREICAARGGRLPTEAEWEWAAGNLTRESSYPWGEDPEVCRHAVVARAETLSSSSGDSTCRTASGTAIVPAGPAAGGGADDLTALGVRDLAGNLGEFVEDAYGLYDEPCWLDGPTPLVNPRCDTPSSSPTAPAIQALRGGSWTNVPLSAAVYLRNGAQFPDRWAPDVGFRCVVPLPP